MGHIAPPLIMKGSFSVRGSEKDQFFGVLFL